MKKTFKRIRNALIIALSVIIVFFLFITQCGVPTFFASEFKDHSTFLRDCVSANPSLKIEPLTNISLLGSHDALSNQINVWSKPNISEDNLVNNDALRVFGKGAIVRYARAQNDSIYNQLTAGIRYIDIRVTNIDGEFYNSHGLLSSKFKDNLLQILRFLDNNPGEFILIQICKYYKGSSSDIKLKQMMEDVKYNEKDIFDYIHYDSGINEFKDLNYNILTVGGTKAGVVLFANSREVDILPFNQFNFSHYSSHWHNTIDEEKITQKIVDYAQYGKSLGVDYLRINQTQQTPNVNEIWQTFLGWSLLDMARRHNYNMVNRDDINDILDGLPIYMCDYSTCNNNGFNSKIIELMYQRNIAL